MSERTSRSVAVLLAAVCIAVVVGCAGTTPGGGGDFPNDPELLRKEIVEIDSDILNMEEMYKASLTQMQMEEDAELRREVNEMWMDLEELRARKAALEERLAEIEAQERE
jgi:hypothetical protein